MGTARLESFSDGVIAVAITLLVLGLQVPGGSGQRLLYDLGNNWQEYAAYATSFLTIGIIWINHHAMLSRLREADHSILILNLLLLMSIGVLPFATNLMATYLRRPSGETVAAAVYGASFLLMALLFAALNGQIMLRRSHLLRTPLPLARRRLILMRSWTGLVPYAVATGLALVSPYITLAICGGLAGFYALPFAAAVDQERVSSA
jgi:uncharacterized membrane protein